MKDPNELEPAEVLALLMEAKSTTKIGPGDGYTGDYYVDNEPGYNMILDGATVFLEDDNGNWCTFVMVLSHGQSYA